MYEQSLYKILPNYIKPKVINQKNRYNKWEYGYNKEFDMIVISKTGKIGEIYEIQNIKIALPKEDNVIKFEGERWRHTEYPKELSRIKSVFDWDEHPSQFKEKWYDYIDKEFKRREEGFWFYNKNIPCYILVLIHVLAVVQIDVGSRL